MGFILSINCIINYIDNEFIIMKQYNFLCENALNKIKSLINAGTVGKRLTYIAAGGLAGNTIGGAIGTLYGVKLYHDKEKTLNDMEKEIMDPKTSQYTRLKIIDMKNLIQSMTDEEYRDYIVKDCYEKGKTIGKSVGSVFGATLGMLDR